MRPGPRAIDAREPIQSEVIGWRRKDSNEILWTLGNAVPQFGADGSVSAVINTFTNITERKQAEEALHQLSTRLLQLQDEERRRLGRELHDSLAQSVLAVNLNLAQATRSLTALDERSRHSLAEARRVLAEMSREIRTLSYLLHPPLLDELGLVSAVKEYAEGFSERSGIKLELDVQAGFGRLPQERPRFSCAAILPASTSRSVIEAAGWTRKPSSAGTAPEPVWAWEFLACANE